MGKTNRGGKPGLMARRKSALKLLEAQLEKFQKAGEDKAPWTSTRNGGKRVVNHKGRPFQQEVERIAGEIKHLKELIH